MQLEKSSKNHLNRWIEIFNSRSKLESKAVWNVGVQEYKA